MEYRNPFAGAANSEQDHDHGSVFTGESGPHGGAGSGSLYANNHGANTSTSFGESSASLVDPMLDFDGATERRLLRRSQKFVPPIQIPEPLSNTDGHGQTLLPSPAMRSSTFASSFPLPPPRTPLTPSHSIYGSAYSNPGRASGSVAGSSVGPDSPRTHLSVPPPSPNTFRHSGQSGYWDADISGLRDTSSQTGRPVLSPDLAAQTYRVQQQDQLSTERVKSYIAELSSESSASPRHPPVAYPPAAYSPNSNSARLPPSKSRHDSPTMLAAAGGQMALPPSPGSSDHRNYVQNRDSSGTFGTLQSSLHSFGVSGALNTLEQEGFGFHSSHSPGTSRDRGSFSDAASFTSSIGQTHQLVRMGSVLEARPAAHHNNNNNSVEYSRRTRASLVSSHLLRSASSMDALKSVLQDGPPSGSGNGTGYTSLRPPVRPRQSSRYSSGPAPTLASLAEDGHEPPDGQTDLLPDSQRRRKQRRYSLSHSRRLSDWASRSLKSASSHKSRRSSATHFTVASQAPTVPSLYNHRKRAEIVERESRMPTRSMAKRASTLSQLLENKPSQGRYISSYPNGTEGAEDDIDELRFSSQRLKAKKVGFGIPGIWSTKGAGEGMTFGRLQHLIPEDDNITIASTQDSRFADPVIEPSHVRRRRSYPAQEIQNNVMQDKEKYEPQYNIHPGHGNGSSYSSQRTIPHSGGVPWFKSLTSSKRKKLVLLLLFLAVLIIVLGVLGGTVFNQHSGGAAAGTCSKTCLNGGRAVGSGDTCSCTCAGGFVGSFCQLDPTCSCLDGSGTCDFKLAKNLLSAASYASTVFTPPVNTSRLANSMHLYFAGSGDPNNCSAQAQLLDLPNLDPARYKARQKWTQAVLLWDMASSEDFDDTTLRDFENSLNYWQWQDSPAFQAQPTFQTTSHGYTIDFAYEKVFAPQKDVNDAGLSATQASRLDNTTGDALERLLAFSTAASTQRTTALSHLFTELGFTSDQLSSFRTNIQSAPVFFPFDISGQINGNSALDEATKAQASGQTFPPPLACQSGLSLSDLNSINELENGIFGLPENASSAANANCSESSRPLYGLLDLMNLRLPPSLSGLDAPGQAVVIANSDIKRRMTFYAGELLSGVPFGFSANVSGVTADTFGTYDELDAVLLSYVNQLSSTSTITDFVNYILQSSSTSPTAAPASLSDVPILEVQLWGGLPFSDIDYVVSSLALASGNTIFGTSRGSGLRNWAHSSQNSKPIRWALNATSTDYALDNGNDPKFQQVWDSSASSSEAGIYGALQSNGLLST